MCPLPRVSFFFSFLFLLLQPFTVLMKQTRQAVRAMKQSIFLDVYGGMLLFLSALSAAIYSHFFIFNNFIFFQIIFLFKLCQKDANVIKL